MKICQKCGAELTDNAKFCDKCGNPLENNALEGTVVPTAKPQKTYLWALATLVLLAVLVGLAKMMNTTNGVSLSLPTLPQEITNRPKTSGFSTCKVKVNAIKYKADKYKLTITLSVEMVNTYSNNNQSIVSYVGYKLKQLDGTVVDSGTIPVTAMAEGDIVQQEYMIFGKCDAGKKYKLELYNVTT